MASRATALLVALAALGCAERLVPVPGTLAVEVGFDSREAVLALLSPVPHDDVDRKDRLLELFRLAGCTGVEERRPGAELPNLICTLPGASGVTIVVAAHFDRRSYGTSAVDNWSGAALLPTLYRALSVAPRRHTFAFIGFSEVERVRTPKYEELPPASQHFLHSLTPGERRRLVAMVNLKGLGLGTTSVWTARADPNLHLDLYSVSRSLNMPLRQIDFRGYVQADIHSFRRSHIPSILIHSFDPKSGLLLEQPQRDRPEAIQGAAYFETYRLVAVYLAYLDRTLERRRALAGGAGASG